MGDVRINPVDMQDSLARIEAWYRALAEQQVMPLTAGGDHLTTLPILRALGRDKPLGMIHFDAHSDTNDSYFGGERFTHGTPFRRAVEEGFSIHGVRYKLVFAARCFPQMNTAGRRKTASPSFAWSRWTSWVLTR